MRKKAIVIIILLVLLFIVQRQNNRRFTMSHDGMRRQYIVHFPNNKRSKDLPVLLNFHGGGGDSNAQMFTSRMNETADAHGFMVVYPEGTGTRVLGKLLATWNAGRCCGSAVKENVDDIGFTRALIEELQKKFQIDPKRVYVTGFSNGAQFAFRTACELSDLVAAVAPVDGQQLIDDCHPSRPVPILYFHGTEDPCVPLEGGNLCGGCFASFLGIPSAESLFSCPSVAHALSEWRTRNNCSQTIQSLQLGQMNCQTTECGASPVTFCPIENGGHTWAGGSPPKICIDKPDGVLCTRYKTAVGPLRENLNINDAMWEFFSQYTL